MFDIQTAQENFYLEGRIITLRLFSKDNITDLYINWLNDRNVMQFSNQRFFQHTHTSCLEYLKSFANTDNLFLAIYLKEKNIYIGTMTIYVSNAHHVADIGIMIGDKKSWGIGVGSDAWGTVLNWLINNLNFRKVTGGALAGNKSMIKIMSNLNMIPDGIRKNHEIVDKKPQDLMYFAKFNNNYL